MGIVGAFVMGVVLTHAWHKRGTIEWWARWCWHKARGHHR